MCYCCYCVIALLLLLCYCVIVLLRARPRYCVTVRRRSSWQLSSANKGKCWMKVFYFRLVSRRSFCLNIMLQQFFLVYHQTKIAPQANSDTFPLRIRLANFVIALRSLCSSSSSSWDFHCFKKIGLIQSNPAAEPVGFVWIETNTCSSLTVRACSRCCGGRLGMLTSSGADGGFS